MLEDVYLNSHVLAQLCYVVLPAYTGSNSQSLAYESFALIMRRKLCTATMCGVSKQTKYKLIIDYYHPGLVN